VNRFYKKEGALDNSFKTISAFGPHSSIIHYSEPKSDYVLPPEGGFVLLDSGAYYESGLATDTTRTIFIGKPTKKHQEIYTLVLKGLLAAQMSVFPKETIGAQIDGIARYAMRLKGYDYAHGTGHGIGVNVHEPCFGLSRISSVPLKEGTAGSIEPGIYLPDFGGVRLENCVVVEAHPEYPGMLRFRPLTFIGFDHSLIIEEWLTIEEKKYLIEYEGECRKRGSL